MMKTIVATFSNYSDAQRAAHAVKEKGLRTDDISIVTKQGERVDSEDSQYTDNTMTMSQQGGRTDNISDGVLTGGILGGLAGILLGAGSMVIPGLGVIAAAGPITGLLSGAVTGSIVGGLVDLGIPEDEGKFYEDQIRQGKVLFSMKTEDENITKITSILKSNAAQSVDTY